LLEAQVVDDGVQVVVADVAFGVQVVEVAVVFEDGASVRAGDVVFDAEGVEAFEEVFGRADEDACVRLDQWLLVRVERDEVLALEEQALQLLCGEPRVPSFSSGMMMDPPSGFT